ncbi:MAG: Beta-galactosidase C-terminal domain, partial [Acutalibacter sp.]|nr:Beta-galactosidase C-terminal domain [Acutalibacter sp.]
PQTLPEGVEACLREKDGAKYVFLQNFSGKPQSISLPEGCVDLVSGEAVSAAELAGYDSRAVQLP